ncbi:MAG: DMT family transporter [Candidatus Neomarinimicrobiota bacterium]
MKIYFIVIAIISAILFGVSTPLSKYLLTYFNEFQLAGLLYIGAACGTLPSIILKWKTEPLKIVDKKNTKYILGSIGFGGILGSVFLLFGLGYSQASSVSLWLNLELVATAILGVIFFKDHLDRNTWIGIIITLCAGILLTYNEGNSGLIAIVFISMACICWGLDNHFTALIDGINANQITFIKGVVAGFVNLMIGTAIGGHLPQYQIILGAVILGVFAYGISIVLYIKSAQHLGATRSQVIFSSAPFFGFLSSWLILSENIGIIQIITALLMGIAIWIIIKSSHNHRHIHNELTHIHVHTHDDEHHNHEHSGKSNIRHSHKHRHDKTKHEHPHFPDLHHRHEH